MKTLRRLQIRTFEETALQLQSFTIPKLGNKQDKVVRRIYIVANLMRAKEGLAPKIYPMLNHKGEVEEVR